MSYRHPTSASGKIYSDGSSDGKKVFLGVENATRLEKNKSYKTGKLQFHSSGFTQANREHGVAYYSVYKRGGVWGWFSEPKLVGYRVYNDTSQSWEDQEIRDFQNTISKRSKHYNAWPNTPAAHNDTPTNSPAEHGDETSAIDTGNAAALAGSSVRSESAPPSGARHEKKGKERENSSQLSVSLADSEACPSKASSQSERNAPQSITAVLPATSGSGQAQVTLLHEELSLNESTTGEPLKGLVGENPNPILIMRKDDKTFRTAMLGPPDETIYIYPSDAGGELLEGGDIEALPSDPNHEQAKDYVTIKRYLERLRYFVADNNFDKRGVNRGVHKTIPGQNKIYHTGVDPSNLIPFEHLSLINVHRNIRDGWRYGVLQQGYHQEPTQNRDGDVDHIPRRTKRFRPSKWNPDNPNEGWHTVYTTSQEYLHDNATIPEKLWQKRADISTAAVVGVAGVLGGEGISNLTKHLAKKVEGERGTGFQAGQKGLTKGAADLTSVAIRAVIR